MQLRPILTVVIAFSTLAIGCAKPDGQATSAPGSPASSSYELPPVDPPAIDWENKCPGDAVTSLSRDATGLAYDAYLPKNLGTPIRIRVCPPEDQVSPSQVGDRATVLIYDHEIYGRVIFEQYPYRDAEEFSLQATRVVSAARPGSGVTLEIVRIRGGLTAILTNDESKKPARSHVIWVENGTWFNILGPTLSSDQVLAIAEGA